MARTLVPSSFFVYVVVPHDGHLLLVREAKHGQRWYAPAGGVEPGESIREAAIRETLEEAGVLVEPLGILRVEQQWLPREGGLHAWWRFVLVARPSGSLEPKRAPDHHSLEARWVRPEDVPALPLRHPEVVELAELARTGVAIPLDPSAGAPV